MNEMSPSFLQSVEWEALQQRTGKNVFRIDDILVIEHLLRWRLYYYYAPRPIFINEAHQNKWLRDAEEILKKSSAIFLKIDPEETLLPSNINIHAVGGRSVQPQRTTTVDLLLSVNDLFAHTYQKTRYNIRLAERRGVMVKILPRNASSTFEQFWILLQETAVRDGFRTHPKSYYETLVNIRSDKFENELMGAFFGNELVAVAIVNFFQPSMTATYLHGASSRLHREVMGPSLLHWEIIQEAKRRGFRQYDFWGIDEVAWPGLTRFKLGFGGQTKEYPPTIDIVHRVLFYKMYCVLHGLK